MFSRSGLASKYGLRLANCIGLHDSYYHGEYMVALHNYSINERTVNPEDRIAQLVVIPYLDIEFNEIDELTSIDRGDVVDLEYRCTINRILKI